MNNSLEDVDLAKWMKEKNSLLAENGVKINRVNSLTPGKYELELALDNLEVVRALEDGYTKYTEYLKDDPTKIYHPDNSKSAKKLVRGNHAVASTRYKDTLMRSDLDILGGFDPHRTRPQDIYKKSIDAYQSKGIYGVAINVLCNFAAKGFTNDIDDPDIKNFYDTWGFTVGFPKLVEKIFLDLIKVGDVTTYKVVGRYVPSINTSAPKSNKSSATMKSVHLEVGKIYKEFGYNYSNSDEETLAKIDEKIKGLVDRLPAEHAARKIKWSKNFIPIGYTILNPTLVEVKGNLLFGGQVLTLKADDTLKKYFEIKDSDLSDEQKRLRRLLPADFRAGVETGDEIILNPDLVGKVEYRKQDYERYAMPRGLRAFDSMTLKDALSMADMSTVDGVNNYILKVTVGTDAHPMTDLSQLDVLADIFNSAQKAYTVFWNHTLDIEKITFPEIDKILGSDKYEQVEKDITGALGIVRGLIDGGASSGSTPASIELAVKSIIEEVNYLRREVERWIYKEYRDIAEGMGFDRFPKVRFDNNALKDELKMMSQVQGMIDRRIISYQSGIELLNLDPTTIFAELEREKPHVINGDYGIIGSPYNPKLTPMGGTTAAPDNKNVQPKQRTPTGTPSEGRPNTGGMGKPKATTASLTLEVMEAEDTEVLSGILNKGSFTISKKDDNFVKKNLNTYMMFASKASYEINKFQATSQEEAIKKAKSLALLAEDDMVLLFKGTGTVGRNTFFELTNKVRVISEEGGDEIGQ